MLTAQNNFAAGLHGLVKVIDFNVAGRRHDGREFDVEGVLQFVVAVRNTMPFHRLDDFDACRPVLAVRAAVDLATQQLGHELEAVADAKHWDAELEDLRIDHRRAGLFDAVGAPGQDDALRPEGADLLERHGAGVDLAVDVQLPDPTGDELRVLRPEIEDQDLFCVDVRHP